MKILALSHSRTRWTTNGISFINRNKSLQVYLDHTGRAFSFRPKTARWAHQDALQSNHLQSAYSQPRLLARRKGLFAPAHASRSRQIPRPFGALRHRRGKEGGAYPQRLDDHGELRGPGVWHAPGPASDRARRAEGFPPCAPLPRISRNQQEGPMSRALRAAGR